MPLSFFARGILGGCLVAILPSLASAQSSYITNGLEYNLVGILPGDQVHPQLQIAPSGGYVVWEDNITDGNGFGISARKLDSTLSGTLSSFRVNSTGTNDQERPQVALLKNGAAAFVWQGGRQGFQSIYARFLNTNGTWTTPTNDVRVNTYTNKSKVNPAVATLANGNVAVVWGSFGQFAANSLQDVYAQLLSPTGTKIGSEFLINQFTTYNQRTPAIAALSTGGFIVVWVSEGEQFSDPNTGLASIDIYARLFTSNGVPSGGEFRVNTGTNICANPHVVAGPSGGYLVTWGERDMSSVINGWDVFARPYPGGASSGVVRRINSTIAGDQIGPKAAANGNDFMVVWTSFGQDGSREGVYGQFLQGDGSFSGTEQRINTTILNSQYQPTVSCDGNGRFLTLWCGFSSIVNGMDLYAQRFGTDLQPLAPPGAPYVNVISSNALAVSWTAVSGYAVTNYEVYANGFPTPVGITTNTWWTATNLAASTPYYYQLAYVLGNGRRSPLSAATTNTTYGTLSWGGIPYEWMLRYYGSDIFAWPAPMADGDGDGATTLDEFRAGTNPTLKTSVLVVKPRPTPQGLFLDWNTEPGLVYQPQISSNMTVWSNVGPPRFAAGTVDSMNVGVGGRVGYYRVNRLR